ncbi:YndM family protein [Lentibacillus sp. N15]|uniref:YndM family protein n=1 Tax=Lentibacillus songyuanensis TaxID=3136161 RepID=UPI0031BAD8E4
MGHLKVLGIKFVAISIITFSTFGIFFNATLTRLFWISLLVTGVSYLIGDLFVLRKFGNIVASIADFALAFVSFWVLGGLLLETGMGMTSIALMAAFLMSLVEPLLHAYIQEQFFDVEHHIQSPATNQLQAEFAEETDPQTMTTKENNKDSDR